MRLGWIPRETLPQERQNSDAHHDAEKVACESGSTTQVLPGSEPCQAPSIIPDADPLSPGPEHSSPNLTRAFEKRQGLKFKKLWWMKILIQPSIAMPVFFVADLNVRGELRSIEQYEYAQLEQIPGAGDIIADLSGALWAAPKEFEKNLPHAKEVTLRWWACAETAGIATVRSESELVSLSLLASGKNPEADLITFSAFQSHLLRELRDTGFEPAFALMELAQRPIVATINFSSPKDRSSQLVAALADRCFGASYFRYLQMV